MPGSGPHAVKSRLAIVTSPRHARPRQQGDNMAGLNATFFAFRKRDRGGVLLGASLAYAVIALVIFGLFAWMNWQAMIDYMNWSMSLSERTDVVDPNDPNAVFAAMTPPASVMAIIPAYFLMTL